MRQLAKLSVLVALFSTTSGCGWLWGDNGYFRNRSDDYLKAKQVDPIQIPEDLQSNSQPLDPLYPIPSNVGDAIEAKYVAPRPVPLQAVADTKLFSLHTNKGEQWLVAQYSPLEVYPKVLHYFKKTAGFSIERDQIELGEFRTYWIKPNQLSDALAMRLMAVDSSLNKKEIRVRVRIEPRVQLNSSDIYILVAQRPENTTADAPWPTKSQNITVESLLLDDLMTKASVTQTVESTVSLTEQKTKTLTNVQLVKDPKLGFIIIMQGEFVMAWPRIEQAITKANIKIEDMDQSVGGYYINVAETADGSSSEVGFFGWLFGKKITKEELEARAERYLVILTQVGDTVNVTLHHPQDDRQIPPATAEKILKEIRDNIN